MLYNDTLMHDIWISISNCTDLTAQCKTVRRPPVITTSCGHCDPQCVGNNPGGFTPFLCFTVEQGCRKSGRGPACDRPA